MIAGNNFGPCVPSAVVVCGVTKAIHNLGNFKAKDRRGVKWPLTGTGRVGKVKISSLRVGKCGMLERDKFS